MKPLDVIPFKIDLSKKFQKIDGFGVNINSKYWNNGNLKPVVDLLIEDLGATLFRVDIYGKSNWIDPNNTLGPSSLNIENYKKVYTSIDFKNGWGMMKYLNNKGIEPYITASGIVPSWMTSDGKTLSRYDYFAEMMRSFVDWAKNKEKIDFHLFGPLNETDIGPPEGPKLGPEDFLKLIKLIIEYFREDLEDIKFVLPEQAFFNKEYIKYLVNDPVISKKIGVISMHMYSNIPLQTLKDFVSTIKESLCKDCSVWMGEYGDLDQSGEMEWYVGWISVYRLLNILEAGFNGGIYWDAYDNYHDHDETWSIYGLIRMGNKVFTPKKRYYAIKNVYRFVKKGFIRVESIVESEKVKMLAFLEENERELSIVGMNLSLEPLYLNGFIEGDFQKIEDKPLYYYRTNEEENCIKVEELRLRNKNYPYHGIFFILPPKSIFTITTVKEI